MQPFRRCAEAAGPPAVMPRYAQLVMGPAGSGKVRRGRGRRQQQREQRRRRGRSVGRSVPDGVVSALQSTYCATMVQHCEALGRAVQVVNLDPAAELFSYPVMAGERRERREAVYGSLRAPP